MSVQKILKISTSSFVIAALFPLTAWAVDVPSSAQPGRIGKELRIEDTRPQVGGATIITVPDSGGNGKTLNDHAKFTLKGITLENATAFPAGELEALYADKIGKQASLSTVNSIAASITAYYRNKGYILSTAVVPPQRVNSGVVKIKIIEGHINKVDVNGMQVSGVLEEYVNKIKSSKPMNIADLERYLLLIQDLPGVDVHAVLRPAAGVQGASDVSVTLSETPIDGTLSFDNRGTRYLGPLQAGATLNANNVLGLYERTQFRTVITPDDTSELQYFQLSHDEMIGSEGTKITLSASRTRTQPNYRLEVFDVVGTDTNYSAYLSHPFLRSRQSNLFANIGFDIRNTDSESLGTDLYEDRLRVARVGGSYDFIDQVFDAPAVNRFDAQLSKGFGWDDDTALATRSRTGGETDFWKATVQAERLQPIYGNFSVNLKAAAQMASGKLLSAEQFGIGGEAFNSAYDPSELTGDAGVDSRIELQYTRSGDFDIIPSYSLYTFYGIGEIWTRNPQAGQNYNDSLASAGVGARFNILDALSGNVELAVPLTRPVAANNFNGNGDDPRGFFSLVYKY